MWIHFTDFTPLISHFSDFTPNYLRNSCKHTQKLLKLHTLLPFMDRKHTLLGCKHTFMYLQRPYVTSKIHVIYVITFLSLSAEVRGYLFRFFWPHAKGVSTENDLINLSIWRFPTRTAQIQASLRWRRETNRHFSINWVVWAGLLSHPSSRRAFSDWAELAPPVCKLANTYRPISHHSPFVTHMCTWLMQQAL